MIKYISVMGLFWGATAFGMWKDDFSFSNLVISNEDQKRISALKEDVKFSFICDRQKEYAESQKNLMTEIKNTKIKRKACEHPGTVARITEGSRDSLVSDIENCENRLILLYQQFYLTLNEDTQRDKAAEFVADNAEWFAKCFLSWGLTFNDAFKTTLLREDI